MLLVTVLEKPCFLPLHQKQSEGRAYLPVKSPSLCCATDVKPRAAASLTQNFAFVTAHLSLLMSPQKKNPWERFFSVSINWQISRSPSAISSCFHDKPKRKLDVYWLSQPETRRRTRPLEGRRRARLSDNNLPLFLFLLCLLCHFLLRAVCRAGWKVWGFIRIFPGWTETAGICPNPRMCRIYVLLHKCQRGRWCRNNNSRHANKIVYVEMLV